MNTYTEVTVGKLDFPVHVFDDAFFVFCFSLPWPRSTPSLPDFSPPPPSSDSSRTAAGSYSPVELLHAGQLLQAVATEAHGVHAQALG
jgi:hypothetical protein